MDQLDQWAQNRGLGFTHIYVSKEVLGPVDFNGLLDEARTSQSYRLLIDDPAVAVLERTAPIQPAWSPDGEVLVSRDCQTLADQDQSIQYAYAASYGEQAAWAWVQDHDRGLGEPVTICRRLERLGLTRLGPLDYLCGGSPTHDGLSAGNMGAAQPG